MSSVLFYNAPLHIVFGIVLIVLFTTINKYKVDLTLT